MIGRMRGALVVALLMAAAIAYGGDATASAPPSDDAAVDGAVGGGGVLRFARPQPFRTFDVHKNISVLESTVLFAVYDRLLSQDSEGVLQPGLASEWSYDDSGLELDLTLRDGLTFHDGEVLDAEAVKANLDRGMTAEDSQVASYLTSVASVEVVDELQLRLTLSEPDSTLLGALAGYAGAMISPAAFDNAALEPVGAGPYRVVEYAPDARVIFEPFEDYWNPGVVNLDRVEYLMMPDPVARLNALRSGEVDAAVLEGVQIAEAETSGFALVSRPTLSVAWSYVNRGRPPLDDVRVREALNIAIDRQGIVDAIYAGYGVPAAQYFPLDHWSADPEITADFLEYDPERARELLEDAGYGDGLELRMVVNPIYQPMAEAVAAQFQAIGVTLELEVTDASVAVWREEQHDFTIGVAPSRRHPLMEFHLLFHPDGGYNIGGHTTPEFMAAYDTAKATIDPDEEVEAVQALSRIVAEQYLGIPVYHELTTIAMTDAVNGLAPDIFASIPFTGVTVDG